MSERILLADEVLHRFLEDELGSIRRYALSMTGSLDDADDVVQATVEKVLISGLPADSPKAWLVRVCKNVWIDEIRKRRVRNHENYAEEGESISHVADLEPAPVEARVEQDQRYDAIATALDKLSDDHRMILSMVVVEGMSYAEVAQALELPVGTVMSRVARARTNLRKNIGQEK
jgi:RNA polymerase sigma-70 factor (ECF subfamily)